MGVIPDVQVVTNTERRTVVAVCADSVLIMGPSQVELLRLVPVCVVKGEEKGLGTCFVLI